MENNGAGVSYWLATGPKVQGLRSTFEGNPDLLERYDRIALVDDDIDTDAATLSACFDIGEDLSLSIWQPALSWESYFTFAATLRNPQFKCRDVNVIEMMCPFFTRDALIAALPLFNLGYEVGIDLIWCSLLADKDRRFAIIDETPVRHTRAIGTQKVRNGFPHGDYEDHICHCLSQFDAQWPSIVARHGILADGTEVTSRLSMALRTLAILPAISTSPQTTRIKAVLDHIRHQVVRRPGYIADAKAHLGRAEAYCG